MTKIDKDKTYTTRDGSNVRIYSTDGGGFKSVHGALEVCEGDWRIEAWDCNGKAVDDSTSHPYDLIEVKPRIKRWLNIYPLGKAALWSTLEEASRDKHACSSTGPIIARISIDYKGGEGL